MVHFVIPFSIHLLILALFYALFLRKINAGTCKRAFLLGSVPFAVMLTYLQYQSEMVSNSVVWLNEYRVNSNVVQSISASGNYLWFTYLIGVGALLIYHLLGLFHLVRVTTGSEIQNHAGITYWYSSKVHHVFSVFGKIYAGSKHVATDILIHEKQHVDQLHTIDKLLFVCLKTVLWFHPAVHLLDKWSEENNEFLVDEAVQMNGVEQESYIQLLKLEAVKKIYPEWVMPFSKIKQLKHRIAMMRKEKKNSKAGVLTAVACGLLLVFAPVINTACNKGGVPSGQSLDLVTSGDENEEIYTQVDEMPKFPGGEGALFQYLGEHIKYPKHAEAENVEGTVYVSFVVDKNGEVGNVEILKGINADCDRESMRVISEMPEWTPGKQKGKAVSVQYNIPIKFVLE